MTRNPNPEARLAEILAQREKVRELEERLVTANEKLRKVKEARDDLAAEVREAQRVLVEIIDDRPPGPLFEREEHAGDGPIEVPPGAPMPEGQDEAGAKSQAEAEKRSAKRRAAKRKN